MKGKWMQESRVPHVKGQVTFILTRRKSLNASLDTPFKSQKEFPSVDWSVRISGIKTFTEP